MRHFVRTLSSCPAKLCEQPSPKSGTQSVYTIRASRTLTRSAICPNILSVTRRDFRHLMLITVHVLFRHILFPRRLLRQHLHSMPLPPPLRHPQIPMHLPRHDYLQRMLVYPQLPGRGPRLPARSEHLESLDSRQLHLVQHFLVSRLGRRARHRRHSCRSTPPRDCKTETLDAEQSDAIRRLCTRRPVCSPPPNTEPSLTHLQLYIYGHFTPATRLPRGQEQG